MPWNIAQTHACGLGESPFWHPTEHCLYWVDIPRQQILRAQAQDALGLQLGAPEIWAMPSEPGCIAPAASGGLVIALRDGIYRARSWGGPLSLLVAAQHDPRTARFNDGKCDAQGRFWVGTIYEPRDAALAALYRLDLDGGPRLSPQLGHATVANGLAWSPDAQTLYWADTPSHQVRSWDWDAASGALRAPAAPRLLQQFAAKPHSADALAHYQGRPDGAAVDAAGNYWVAMFEGQRLCTLSPQGERLADTATPVRCPTMPCFGGPDLQTLYLTSASHQRPAAELAQQPQAGCVLATRVATPGLGVNFFAD